MKLKSVKKIISFIISVLLIVPAISSTVFAADTDVTESSTYVLDRDSNGDFMFQYQSPCSFSYDLENWEKSWSTVNVYTMYDQLSGDHFPAYCCDITTTANKGANYRRMNIEDSPFAGTSAGRIRAILTEGFYVIPIKDESIDAHAVRVKEKAAQLGEAAGIENLTVGEAISATQLAIWRISHGSILTFPQYCRSFLKPSMTKYASLCSYDEVKAMGIELVNSRIEAAFNYLISLEPIEAAEKTVSSASFKNLNRPVLTRNPDGTYNISVTTTIDVEIREGDSLTLKAQLGENYSATSALTNGEQTITLTLNNVPASVASGEVKLSISGYQTAAGFFYFDAEGERGTSQSMVGYNNGRHPVYAEAVAADERIINIHKTTNKENGNEPISDIIFDIYLVATKEEYESGAVKLPEATEYDYPNISEYTLITDENGNASLNLLYHGLPDGVYLIVERNSPKIVKPLDPFYVVIPDRDPVTNEPVYEVTINPKNELKPTIKIEKDVIFIGNDEASVNAYEEHTWIIGTTIPSDIADGKSYVVTDTLDNRLDYAGNLKVFLEDKEQTADPLQLSLGTDYNVTLTDVDSLSDGKPSDSFSVELTVEGMAKIAAAIGENKYSNYMLRIYFDAKINANATMATQIPNQAAVKYINSADEVLEKESDKPYVYTGAINLLKVDSEDNSKLLPNAVFEVYRTATADEVGAEIEGLTELPGLVGKFVKVSFFDNSALTGEKVTTVKSDENGKVAIYGLAYGTYYLLETDSPAGYNKLGNTVELTINDLSHTDEKAIVIENESGIVLPETGGIGTTIFTVLGFSFIALAGVLLICKRRTN